MIRASLAQDCIQDNELAEEHVTVTLVAQIMHNKVTYVANVVRPAKNYMKRQTNLLPFLNQQKNGYITSIEPHLAHDALPLPDVHEDPAAPVLAFPHILQCDRDIQRTLTTDSQEL
jgi:hypothetical protein